MIIYKITNLVNSKIYIGQTINSIEKRWARHTWATTKKRNAMAITSSIIKYGEDNFIIEQIDTANSIDELNEKEIYYIELYNSLSPNGYNISPGGGNRIMSEETKLKLLMINKGRKASDETRKKLSESHKGWVPSEETRQKWRDAFSGKSPSENTIKAAIEARQKTFTLLSPDGKLTTFTNMKNFCDENGLSNSSLCNVANGKNNSHKGWTKPKEV